MIHSIRRPILVAEALCVGPVLQAQWCSLSAACKGQTPAIYLPSSLSIPKFPCRVFKCLFCELAAPINKPRSVESSNMNTTAVSQLDCAWHTSRGGGVGQLLCVVPHTDSVYSSMNWGLSFLFPSEWAAGAENCLKRGEQKIVVGSFKA